MKTSKQRISLLKNKIEEKLSEENDIYGFEGISKKLIIDLLNESYNLLGVIDDFTNSLEVIILKRELVLLIDEANNYLNGNFPDKNNFNEFLNIISKIKKTIKITYISVTEKPFRVESDMKKATEDLAGLIKKREDIESVHTEILNAEKDVEEFRTNNNDVLDKISKKLFEVSTLHSDITEKLKIIETSFNSVSAWTETISGLNKNASSVKKEIEELKTNMSTDIDTLSKKITTAKELEEILKNLFEKDKEFQAQIEKTITDANQHGMAGSFFKRKEELKWPTIFWAGASILSILLFAAVSAFIIMPELFINLDKIQIPKQMQENFWYRFALIGPMIWLGWFTSKQYGFSSRIKEDYSYKYALSMAFEKYKTEALEVNEDILKELIRLVILNISSNPTNLYNSKSNHATPFNEFIENLLKKIKLDLKADIKSPPP